MSTGHRTEHRLVHTDTVRVETLTMTNLFYKRNMMRCEIRFFDDKIFVGDFEDINNDLKIGYWSHINTAVPPPIINWQTMTP